MSEQALKSISSVTGTFATLTDRDPGGQATVGGKVRSANGDSLPLPKNESKPDLERIAQSLNMARTSIGRDLRFEVDTTSGRSIIHVLDRETGEIIRQIPPEKASTYMQMQGGLAIRLYDEVV